MTTSTAGSLAAALSLPMSKSAALSVRMRGLSRCAASAFNALRPIRCSDSRNIPRPAIREQQGIAATLAQRQHNQRIHRQPPPTAHLLGQIAVGRDDQAHIDLVFAVRADALQLAVLQHAQELGLHGERQLADFVQKERAAIGEFEFAAPVGKRARDRAAHVPEQLAFDECIRQRRAVQADERLVGARRRRVYLAGDEFLADARFARDEHGQIARCDDGDVVHQPFVAVAAADDVPSARPAARLPVHLGALPFGSAGARERFDALRDADRLRGQAQEGLQGRRIDIVEAGRIERVEREQAHGRSLMTSGQPGNRALRDGRRRL